MSGHRIAECRCPRAQHQHGTKACYKQCGCRCPDCRAVVAAAQRRRYIDKALGRYQPAYLEPIGAQRRLQALAVLGWSPRMIGRYCDASGENLARIRCGRKRVISRALHEQIKRVYDDLWDHLPPRGDRHQRDSVTRTQRYAQRRGWAPPLAWDDDEIDRPEARPRIGRKRPNPDRKPCGTLAAARRHYRHGEPLDEACRRAEQRGEDAA